MNWLILKTREKELKRSCGREGKDGQIEFRYRITEGKSDKSYGIHVAELAKLPDMVITRAEDLLKTYEEQDEGKTFQPSFFVMEKVIQPEMNC